MPISSTQRKFGPTPGNGVAKDFPFTCKVFATSDIQVIRTSANGGDTSMTPGTDFTVALNADQDAQPGGTVSLAVALPAGQFVTLLSAVPNTQPTDWQNQGGFAPDTLDESLDRGVAQTQQLAEQLGRTLKVPATVGPVTMAKPQGGGLLAWNADGTQVINIDPAQVAGFAAYSSSELSIFTGDGVETVFPLGVDGGSLANLRVSIAGVAQTPGVDFTWPGGALIEFAEPPADGLTIVVQYFAVMASSTELNEAIEAVLAALSGKANVNFDNVPLNVLSSEWRAALPGTPDGLLITPDGGPAARPASELFGVRDTTPMFGWVNTRILWPGTSIPAQGQNVDSYPGLTGKRLRAASVVEVAWAGSHASYAGVDAYAALTTEAQKLNHISSLSMLKADVDAGLALYGPTSAYSDTFNNITLASQQTADYRLKPAFDAGDVDVVVFDHNHNEPTDLGALNQAQRTVTAVSLGANTQLTLSDVSGLAVGGALTFRVQGIPKLAYAAGRIQAIAGNVVTTSVNSTGYAGAFTSGVAFLADRSTLYGGFDFCLHYIYWAAANANRKRPVVILSSAPSEFTGGAFEPRIYTIARAIQAFADKWDLAMFDVAAAMKITEKSNKAFLGDDVHPIFRSQREVFANFWTEFLKGGAVPTLTEADYVARGIGDYRNQREIAYSVWYGGATTLDFVVLDGTSIVTENFNPISGSWVGVGSTSVITAPWNAGLKALRAVSTANSEAFIFRNALASTSAISLKTTLHWPTLPTATGMNVQSAGLLRLESASGVWLSVNIVTTSAGSFLQIGLFALPGNDPAGYRTRDTVTGLLSSGVPYEIELLSIQERPDQPGRLLFYVNGVDAFGGPIQTNDPTQVGATTLVLGIQSSTEGSLTVDYGPVTYGSLAVYDNRDRYTGTLALVGGGTATVVLGNITKKV